MYLFLLIKVNGKIDNMCNNILVKDNNLVISRWDILFSINIKKISIQEVVLIKKDCIFVLNPVYDSDMQELIESEINSDILVTDLRCNYVLINNSKIYLNDLEDFLFHEKTV